MWFRLNGQGYALVLGDPTHMNGYARILVLGAAGAEGTLSGYTPALLENKISEFRGWLRDRYHFGSYGLKGSIYEDYLSTVSNWNTRHPAYPVTGMGGDGKRDPDFWRKVKERLRDSRGTRAEKVRALSQMDLRVDLRGLTFFNMPGSVANELEQVDGALIADILHRRSEGTHEPVVTRVIEPMAGSGVYSNWVRAQGFKGKVILNDINPLIALTQSEVVSHPQGVTRGVQEIKSDLLAISRQHGFDFDDNLSMSFERVFPDDVPLSKKKDEERIRKQEKLKEFVRQDRADNLRQAVKDYFEDSLAELISLKDGKMVVDEPAVTQSGRLTARTRVAALFYVMQNAANHSGAVTIKQVPSVGYRLHLPLSLLTAEKHYNVHLLPLITNERKLFFISRLHGGNLDTTEFLNGDGWELFTRADVGPGDLILLSGHFSNSYLSVEEFYEKVDRYVTRAVEKGAQVLIINDFSEAKEQGFKQRGFQVSRHARSNDNKRSYLLALRNVVAASSTPEVLNNRLRDFVVAMHDIEKRVGFIPGEVLVGWSDEDYYDPEAAQRANVEQWALAAADDEGREPLSQADSVLNRDEVGEWDLPAPAASNEGESTSRFDYQLIVQLEDNRTVRQAAIDLAGKHPSNSLLLQLDVAGKLRFAEGQDALLARINQLNRKGKNHWRLQAVGHGRDDAAGQRTLAGYLPSELAQTLKQLLDNPLQPGQARAVAPEHISLVGCALVDNEPTATSSYIQAFVHALDREKLSVRSVAAHSAKIIVNPQGGKRGVTLTDTKLVLRRSGDTWMAVVAPGKTGYDDSLLLTETLGEKLAQLGLKKQRLGVVSRAQEFQQGMAQLYRDNDLSEGEWLPLWHRLTQEEAAKGGEYRLEFVQVAHPEQPTRVVRLTDRRVVEFMQDYNRQLTKVAQAREVQGEHLAGQPGEPEGEALDGLNALFIVQTLFAWFSHKSRTEVSGGELTGVLGCSLQVHGWLNTAQIIHGTVMDVVKVVQLFRSALAISKGKAFFSQAQSLNVMSSISKLNIGVGLFLNLGSVVLDAIELSQAQNEAQRAVFGTQLAFDSAGLALGVFSLGASMAANAGIVGAATASGFAGALAAPLAGLGIGFSALAQAFSAVAEEAAQVGSYFAGLDAAYRQGGYRRVERKNSTDHVQDDAPGHVLMESIPGAVISTLDLRRQQLTLDSQYLYRNDPTNAVGSGRSNYFFWWPGRGANLDKNLAINIREGIGYRQAQVSFVPGDAVLVLPMTAKSYLNYEYMILPFATSRNDHGFDVLRRLEEDGRFDFDFYAFPGERIVRRIMPEYVETPVRVLLDAQERDILVPALPDILQGKLSYQLEGEGGHYRLSLQDGVSISLGGTANSRWTLDARQLKEAAISLNGNRLQVGSLAITLSEHCGEISLINASGELFSVDREKQQLILLEADGSGFMDWQALHAHLKQLTADSPHSQPFVAVDHYRRAGYDIGRAFYQVSLDRFIYTDYPQASEFLGEALLGGIVEDKAWFYRGADVWQVAIATGQVLVQYRPRSFGGNITHSSLVQRDGQLLLAIEELLPDCSVEHIYRVEEASLKLLAIHRVGQLFNPGENSLALLSAAAHWRDPLQRMTERQVSATHAQVVTCAASQGQTTERQWLVFNNEYLLPRVVRANLGAAMAQDLSLVGSTGGDKPGFYFYDPHGRRAYFQADEGMSGTPATAVALGEVSAVRGGDQSPWLALTAEGSLWLLDRGTARLAGVVASWLSRHREDLTAELGRLASAAPARLDNLVLWGLGGLAGKTTGAWYDCAAQRLVQGGGNLDGRQNLTYLGLTADDRHAWILDGESRQLYRQALLPAETELTFSEPLLPSPAAPDALAWSAPQQWIRGQRQGTRLHLESSDGVMVLLPVAATLTERAVLIALRIKAHQEIAQVGERIAALRKHYDLPSAVRLLTEPGQAPGWYLPDSAELLCAQGPQADHRLTYLGKAAGQAGGYIHDEDNGQLWCLDNLQSTPVGRYSFVHLSDGNLILQLDDSSPADSEPLPVLEEAECLMVSGRSQGVHHYPLDRGLLNHYRQIIIDEQSRDAVIHTDSERLVLQRSGEDLMLYDSDAHTSLLIPDIEQAAQHGTKLQLAPQALSGLLAGLSRP
ncbi:TcdA/TcdB pore-forming domain-containing protein [Pseudomonas batumici]|uniref:TcdA/TcdB pore-forming domain-containing protein n=1 Tax=Pseudomonas batumici TaxID=226910 RepID=UPI001427A97C|nr:TcdA/TcdB pore-forming domain-containing protein [Pseudomonas batumici]